MTEWYENDELFVDQLSVGHKLANSVADKLRLAGLKVDVTPMEVREHIGKRHAFKDEFDLLVEDRFRVEVKSTFLKFNTAAEWPLKEAFVYAQNAWNAKEMKPVAVVLISQETLGTAVVPVSTESQWTTKKVYDTKRKFEYTVLRIEPSLLRTLEDLIAWVKARVA